MLKPAMMGTLIAEMAVQGLAQDKLGFLVLGSLQTAGRAAGTELLWEDRTVTTAIL